jgi:hypothetical protein
MGLGKFLQSVGSGVNGMGAADRWNRYSSHQEPTTGDIEDMAQVRGEKDARAFREQFERHYDRLAEKRQRGR